MNTTQQTPNLVGKFARFDYPDSKRVSRIEKIIKQDGAGFICENISGMLPYASLVINGGYITIFDEDPRCEFCQDSQVYVDPDSNTHECPVCYTEKDKQDIANNTFKWIEHLLEATHQKTRVRKALMNVRIHNDTIIVWCFNNNEPTGVEILQTFERK